MRSSRLSSRTLNRSEPALVKLFEQESNVLLALNPHVWLLSALEALAWSREHLSRVSLILAALDERTPRDASGEQRFQEPALHLPALAAADHRSRRGAGQGADEAVSAGRKRPGDSSSASCPTNSPCRRRFIDLYGATGRSAGPAVSQRSFTGSNSLPRTRLLVEHLGEDIGRWTAAHQVFRGTAQSPCRRNSSKV